MSRKSVALSKANLETEMRNVVKKVAHRPFAEVMQILRERQGVPADPDFVRSLLAEYAAKSK